MCIRDSFDTKLAEGLMLLTPFAADATDDLTVKFVESYKAAYNEVPVQFAADAYDAIYAIKAAIEAVSYTHLMFMDEPVNLLWMMLLTGEEYELVKEQGTDPILEKKGADPAAWNLV